MQEKKCPGDQCTIKINQNGVWVTLPIKSVIYLLYENNLLIPEENT